MSHQGHIEVADEFGGPGERPKMTALPDGFPSNSPVTQRNHAQGDMADHFNSNAQADEQKNVYAKVAFIGRT
jgi:hypothetical protein